MGKVKNLIQVFHVDSSCFANELAHILAEKGYEVIVVPGVCTPNNNCDPGARLEIYSMELVDETCEGKADRKVW